MPLNCPGLADFRVDSVEVLDRLLTQSVTALIAEGLISLAAIAVDGTKVRASASRETSGQAKNCSRSKRLSPSVWLRSAGAVERPRGVEPPPPSRARAGRARGSGAAAGARAALERLQAERKSRAKRRVKAGPGEAAEGFDDRPRGGAGPKAGGKNPFA